MYLAAEVQQEDWLQSRLLCLFPLRPRWRDDVSVRTDSGTERPISHSSGLISFYWQGSRSLQWWASGPPEGFSEGKPRPVCSDIKASLRSKARLLDVHTLLAPLLAFLLIQDHHLFSYFLLEKYNKINIHVWGIHKIIVPGVILILSLDGLGSLCFFWPRLETVTLEECLLWEEHTVMCW